MLCGSSAGSMSSTLHTAQGPRRIVCLTEETTELLYLLGEQDRIVGISAYTLRPPEAKQRHPVVSAFVGGSVERIVALRPDLVLGFSDIQADLAKRLIAENLSVLVFNQRSIQEILDFIVTLGRIVCAASKAEALVDGYCARLDALATLAAAQRYHPRVYFEEWDEPMITAIGWVSELIAIAGGSNVFAELGSGRGAKDRFVTREQVLAARPEVVFACWCGKPFDAQAFSARSGFSTLPAVLSGQVFEIPPEIILQPGPAALSDGVDFMARILSAIAPAR
jgi:iron complex transport system substrate-binding protein